MPQHNEFKNINFNSQQNEFEGISFQKKDEFADVNFTDAVDTFTDADEVDALSALNKILKSPDSELDRLTPEDRLKFLVRNFPSMVGERLGLNPEPAEFTKERVAEVFRIGEDTKGFPLPRSTPLSRNVGREAAGFMALLIPGLVAEASKNPAKLITDLVDFPFDQLARVITANAPSVAKAIADRKDLTIGELLSSLRPLFTPFPDKIDDGGVTREDIAGTASGLLGENPLAPLIALGLAKGGFKALGGKKTPPVSKVKELKPITPDAPITPPTKEGIVADNVHKMFERTDIEISDLRKPSVKRVKNKLVTGLVDVSGNIKAKLLREGGEQGKRVVIYHDLVRGSSTRAGQIVNDASSVIYDGLTKSELKQLDRVIQSRRIIEIDNAKKGVKHPEGLGGKEHQQYLDSLPVEELAKANERADIYFDVMRDQLAELRSEGLITKEAHEKLQQFDYSRRQFLEFIDPEQTIAISGKKITVTESGIQSLKSGSEGLLFNDSKALMTDVISRSQSRIAKNRANTSLHDLAKSHPDNGIVSLGKKAPPGSAEISVFIDGKRETMIMKNELANEWITTDPIVNAEFANAAGWMSGAKILRPMATGLNPAFAVTNFPRDIAHVYLTTSEFSKHLPVFGAQMARELITTGKDAILRKGAYRDYINEGGGMEFLTHQGGGGLARTTTGAFEPLRKVLGYVGETSEIWTRLALRERALKNGKSPQEATWIARNYLDFAQGGNWIKAIDTGIPYLNAGVQGTRGIIRAAKNNPKEFMTKVSWVSGTATSLYLANRFTNPEAWAEISEREKVNNWIITTPFTYRDRGGNKRHYYFKVAKDQGQRVMATAAEALLERYLDGKVPSDQVVSAVQDFIPIIPTQLTPPTFDAIFGYLSNFDFWRRKQIWTGAEVEPPAEYRLTTHPFWVDVGKITGMSPERLKRSMSQFFTSGNMYTAMAGGAYKSLVSGMTEEEQDKTMSEMLSQAPFIRRVFTSTRPFKENKKLKEAELRESTRRYQLRLEFDAEFRKFADGRQNLNSVKRFINFQKDANDRKLLKRRLKNSQEFLSISDIPNKTWWLDLAELTPKVRAMQYWIQWDNSSDVERRNMEEIKNRIPGFNTKDFRLNLKRQRFKANDF